MIRSSTAQTTWLPCLLLFGLLGCAPPAEFDLQGHRGARGLLPENSVPGFLKAVDLGVDTIEMDVVVSADSQVVVSHEPWMSAEICSHPDGTPVAEEEARSLNLFAMSYAEVEQFDCGSRGNERFPDQEPMPVTKPLLAEALAAVEDHAPMPVLYNIEIKSRPAGDGVSHPAVATFSELVHGVLLSAGVLDRTTVQSFDPRALEAFRAVAPGTRLAFLVNNEDGLRSNLDRLSFVPQIYSPNHDLVTQSLIDSVHAMNMAIVPWTVNDLGRMQELLQLGVDGIITDYPDLGATLKP